MTNKNVEEAAVMIIVRDRKILSISRRDDISVFGLIGGKRDLTDDSLMVTAIRETVEETTIVVKKCFEVYTRMEPPRYPGGLSFNTTCFYATEWEGEPKDSDEGKVRWLTRSELSNPPPIGVGAFALYNTYALNVLSNQFKVELL